MPNNIIFDYENVITSHFGFVEQVFFKLPTKIETDTHNRLKRKKNRKFCIRTTSLNTNYRIYQNPKSNKFVMAMKYIVCTYGIR